MTEADKYLWLTVGRHAVNNSVGSAAQKAAAALIPVLGAWAGGHLLGVSFSGSYAKGTAISLGTDIDLFVSLRQVPGASMRDIYWDLFRYLESRNFLPQAQNVSIGVRSQGLRVDIVPGRKQAGSTADHTLYRRKADTWTQTNVQQHINLVTGCGRSNEIRALKIWRQRRGLDFPSFYLELTVIDALRGRQVGQLASNVRTVFEYLRDSFVLAVVTDPANTNNRISDDLSVEGRRAIAAAARGALAGNWGDVIW